MKTVKFEQLPTREPVATPCLSAKAEPIKEALLDSAIEMTFPASDPVAISAFTLCHVIEKPDMAPAHLDHQNSIP